MEYQHLSCFSSCLTSLFLEYLHQYLGCKEFLFSFEYTVTLFNIKPISNCNKVYCFVFYFTVKGDAPLLIPLIFKDKLFGLYPANIYPANSMREAG
ncbi:hypothetical protein [Alishewanella longhuensis]|uniref:hypothetical protein n=1 Tax=Alishewanella longhuensis TaxID=1091037 RepID=UPI0016728BBE|nr:hypothetical protein [Alishewanella longhuensis]